MSEVRKTVGANNLSRHSLEATADYSPDKKGVMMIGKYEIRQKFKNNRSVYFIFNTETNRPEPESYDFMTSAILAAIEMSA